jgi:PBSX family phage terminase large subunit
MQFTPFGQQLKFLQSSARIRAALAGRRGGKTEIGAIEAIRHAEQKTGWVKNEIDECIGVIIAPTTDMLRRISLKKFLAYAKPFQPEFHQTHNEITWPNGSIIYGISADKPERLEGIKANWLWLDEVFQMGEQIFLESMARVADTKGRIWATGSLGVQYVNPKRHWIYKYFIENPIEGSETFTWTTADNPHFPREELERLKNTLDSRTYRALFELNWDIQGKNLVYDDFTEANLKECSYNPSLETSVTVDWGWAHKAAVFFVQYNQASDTVHVIDEIVASKMTLDEMHKRIMQKPYRITNWYADIAGNAEREQTGLSNIAWFRQRNIHFKYRTMAIAHSISLVRSYILNLKGQRRLYIDPKRCPNLVDGMKNYKYPEKNGTISGEVPEKKDDDCVDSLRYYFGNRLDYTRPKDTFHEFNRWKVVGK